VVIFKGSWKAFGRHGKYDFKEKYYHLDESYFNVNGEWLTNTEFGNYIAGYVSNYLYGKKGFEGASLAGQAFALQDTISLDSTQRGEWSGYILDDPGSKHFLFEAYKDSNMRVMREIFGGSTADQLYGNPCFPTLKHKPPNVIVIDPKGSGSIKTMRDPYTTR